MSTILIVLGVIFAMCDLLFILMQNYMAAAAVTGICLLLAIILTVVELTEP